jgi:preprotein translocase subunit SecA
MGRDAFLAEKEHLLGAVQNLLERSQEGLENTIQERLDVMDTFFEGLPDRMAEGPVRPQDLLTELSELVRIPLRLTGEPLRLLAEGDEKPQQQLKQQVEGRIVAVSVGRMAGTVERRLGDPLGLQPSTLQVMSWAEAADHLFAALESALSQREQRLFGEGGQIGRDLDSSSGIRNPGPYDDIYLTSLLSIMREGTRMAFDSRTHRRGAVRVLRLNYTYLAGQLLHNLEPDVVTSQVLEHLEQAAQALQEIRGQAEWQRLLDSGLTLSQMDARTRIKLADTLGEEDFQGSANLELRNLPSQTALSVQSVLGWRLQNEAYRQILLRVISDQWVDYLTRVEALRVSIGLEAYAQRDPLVQYKSQASTMFTSLLSDIRMGVVSRLFTFRPQRETSAGDERNPSGEAESQPVVTAIPDPDTGQAAGKKKKKRKRH